LAGDIVPVLLGTGSGNSSPAFAQSISIPPASAPTAPFDSAGANWQGPTQNGGQSPLASLVDAAFAALVGEAPLASPAALLGNESLGDTTLAPTSYAAVAVETARLWEGDVYGWFNLTNSSSLAVEMARLREGDDLSVG
jgi:hypothetical protein